MELLILYSKCFAVVALGLFAHTGMKFNSTKNLHTVSNEKFTFGIFLKSDVIAHLVNIACCLIWMLMIADVIKAYPKLPTFVWIASSALIGIGNSSLVFYFFGAAQRKVMKIIDEKTGPNPDIK